MAQISNRFAIYLAGGRLISMLAGFIMPVLLVRLMPQSEYGLISQFLTLYIAVYTIAAFGIHTSLFYYCTSDFTKSWNSYISNTLFMLFVYGVAVGLFLSIPIVKTVIFGSSVLGMHSDLIIITIALATVMNIVSPLNTIRQDKLGALLFPSIEAFGRMTTIVLCTLLFDDIHSMFLGLLIFQITISMIIVIYTRIRTKFVLDFVLMRKQIAYSFPFGIAVALQLLSNYYDKFVCIKFLTPAEYAIYGIAFLSIPGITQIYDSLCQVNIANMSNSYRNGNVSEIPLLYGNFVKKTLSFSIPVILIVSLYAEEIMSFLYSSEYESAAPYFRLYSLTFLTSMLGAGTILRSVGRTNLSFYAFLITCIIGLPLTYMLVLHFGTTGAIGGAVVNIVLPRIIQMIMEVKVLKTAISKFLPWNEIIKMLAASIILIVPFIVVKMFFTFSILLCVLQALIYIGLLYGFFIKENMFIFERQYFVNKIWWK